MGKEETLEEIYETIKAPDNHMRSKLNDSLYDFYKENGDDEGTDRLFNDRNATFWDLLTNIITDGRDVYEFFDDSIIREKLFTELAKRLRVKYDVIYDAWLRH